MKKDLLERAATDSMARSMNECHTYYLDPDRAKTFNKPPSPVSGIGVTINQAEPQQPIEVIELISSVTDDAVQALRKLQGARGVILDLRDDPGGELSVAVDVGSLFVKTGPLVYQTGRDGNKNPIDVNPRRYLGLNTPLVVLVNKNSASGSEIIAAGVRSSGAGTVMGTRTAGCVGSGQPRDLPDGGLLLVTLTKMQDAKTGEDLNGPGKGVLPDQSVEDDTKTPNVDEAIQAAVAYLHPHA